MTEIEFSPGKLKTCMVDNTQRRLQRNEEIKVYERTICDSFQITPVDMRTVNDYKLNQVSQWREDAILKIERELAQMML